VEEDHLGVRALEDGLLLFYVNFSLQV